MKKNLLQKALYEIIKEKEIAGYGIIDGEDAFISVWNDPDLFYYGKAHCETITEKNYVFFKEKFPFHTLSIAANQKSSLEGVYPDLVFDGTLDILILERSIPFEEDTRFRIKLVDNKEDVETFANVAVDVFHLAESAEKLACSLALDLRVKHCHKYIGYDGKDAEGIVEFSEGKDTVFICWVGVKEQFRRKGLCRAMMTYAINRELERNFNKFVLVSSVGGKIVYTLLGFKDLAVRYNYTLKCRKEVNDG